jgi:hypothetical protein
MNHPFARLGVADAASPPPVNVGDYLCSERDLFRVEHVGEGHGLVENCRNGSLIDVPLAELLAMRPVGRA